jgi:hypothetical protein
MKLNNYTDNLHIPKDCQNDYDNLFMYFLENEEIDPKRISRIIKNDRIKTLNDFQSYAIIHIKLNDASGFAFNFTDAFKHFRKSYVEFYHVFNINKFNPNIKNHLKFYELLEHNKAFLYLFNRPDNATFYYNSFKKYSNSSKIIETFLTYGIIEKEFNVLHNDEYIPLTDDNIEMDNGLYNYYHPELGIKISENDLITVFILTDKFKKFKAKHKETKEIFNKITTVKDHRGRIWETFSDSSYYDLHCVRMVDDKSFNSLASFHFSNSNDAQAFLQLLGKSR